MPGADGIEQRGRLARVEQPPGRLLPAAARVQVGRVGHLAPPVDSRAVDGEHSCGLGLGHAVADGRDHVGARVEQRIRRQRASVVGLHPDCVPTLSPISRPG